MSNVTNNWSSGGTYKHLAREDKRKAKKGRPSPQTKDMICLQTNHKTKWYFENNAKGENQMLERIRQLDTISYEIIKPKLNE